MQFLIAEYFSNMIIKRIHFFSWKNKNFICEY